MESLSKTVISMLMFVGILLVSCGNADYKAIDKKIETDGIDANFTDKEYGAMLDYVEKYVEQQLPKANKRYNLENEQEMKEWSEELDAAFGQVFVYIAAVSIADEEGKLSSTDQKHFNKIMKTLQSISEYSSASINHQYEGTKSEGLQTAPTKIPIGISSPNAFQGYNHEFTGKIGTSARINMHLDLENYTGYYYYLDDSSNSYPKLHIISYDPEETTIKIIETNEKGGATGIFQGYISETGELYGSYTNEYGEESTFHLEVNDAP